MVFEVKVLRGQQGRIFGKVTLFLPHKNATIKGFKEGESQERLGGRSGHLSWVLKNEEELAKSGRATQAEGPT